MKSDFLDRERASGLPLSFFFPFLSPLVSLSFRALTMMKLASLLLATATVLLPAATAFSVQQEHCSIKKPNDGVYCSSRRNLLQKISAASALSLGPVVATSAAEVGEEDSSVELASPKIGGVSLVGWAAAAVILNDVLSNRFSVDSIDGIVPEKDDDGKMK